MSSDYDSSYDSDYRRKQHKKKRDHKTYPIKLCAHLTANLLTTAYKSKIVRFTLDEDPLQRPIYFLAFVESLEMIFSQYKETCEVLLEYPKIGGENIKEFEKQIIGDILHANIDVHSRILIAEFPGDRIKCIEKLQSHCANMNFSEKIRYDRIFQQVTHKGGESSIKYIKIFQNAQVLSVSVGNIYSEDQLIHTFLDNFNQGRIYSSQISSHHAELRRDKKLLIKIFIYSIFKD